MHFVKIALLALGMTSIAAGFQASAQTSPNSSDSLLIRQVFDEVLSHGEAHENLRVLCKDIGHRLSGSPSADRAMAWGQQRMDSYGVDTSYIMPVEVPAWTRGDVAEAQALAADGTAMDLHITALGGSVPTPDDGWIEGPLLVVRHLDALDTLDARGHIVLFNRPMDPLLINTGAAYGGAFDQRGGGASAAAEAGAIGVLVRSLTHALDTLPHTGSLRYKEGVEKLPAAAISTVDASALAKLHREAPGTVQVKMRLNSEDLGTVEQGNVIGEWRGSEFPDEIITLGGHLDSWDIGEGAHDDGSGVVHTLEALRALESHWVHAAQDVAVRAVHQRRERQPRRQALRRRGCRRTRLRIAACRRHGVRRRRLRAPWRADGRARRGCRHGARLGRDPGAVQPPLLRTGRCRRGHRPAEKPRTSPPPHGVGAGRATLL